MQASHQILTVLLFILFYLNPAVIAQQHQLPQIIGNPFLSTQTSNGGGGGGKARYKTVYACEDRMLHIECEHGTRINLIRANYGRFSITQCNEQGQLDLSTDCVSPITVRIMRRECQEKQSCSVNATSSTFGDKCPKTRKYLEAHFQCVPNSEVSIETVNLRTSTTPAPSGANPHSSPFYEQPIGGSGGGIGGHILPPNNDPLTTTANGHTRIGGGGSNGPYKISSQNGPSQLPVQPIFSSSSSSSSMSTGRYHQTPPQQQQPNTVMNSEILTYNDAVNDLQSNYGPNSSSESIMATFRHLHTDNMSNPRCMLWNSNNQEWTSRGSRVIESNITHTTCAFDQATSYCLVMDYMGAQPQTVSVFLWETFHQPDSSTWWPFLLNKNNSATNKYQLILLQPLNPKVPPLETDQSPPMPSRVPSDNPILLDPVMPELLNRQPVTLYPPNNINKSGQQQQQSNGTTNPSSVVSFFSLFGYLLAFVFVLVALMTIAFVVSSMRSSAGATLKSLGNFTAFSGPKYKSGRRSDGSLHHNKDQLLVINNQNGHQFLYTPTNTTKINSSASTHILTSSLANQHQGTLHQIQQQQQQHQLYSGNGTLSNLSGTGGQSNNYYYGLTGLNQIIQQQHLSQHQLNSQQASYHHQANKSTISNESANSSPSSSGVESGSASMHQQQQQQQQQHHHPQHQQQSTCLVLNNDLNLMNHFGNYGLHQQPQHQMGSLSMQDHHTTLTLNAHYNSSVVPMRFSNIQNNGLMREQHIYECVDDDKNYSARLLLPIDQYNSNTLSNHQSNGQMNMGAAPRSSMTLSRFHQQQQPQQQLQSQQQHQTNKRLISHPAIVRDNQSTKTNIICSQMAQVTPQRATELNKFQHDVMAVFNNDSAAPTTTTSTATAIAKTGTSGVLSGSNKLSTDC